VLGPVKKSSTSEKGTVSGRVRGGGNPQSDGCNTPRYKRKSKQPDKKVRKLPWPRGEGKDVTMGRIRLRSFKGYVTWRRGEQCWRKRGEGVGRENRTRSAKESHVEPKRVPGEEL